MTFKLDVERSILALTIRPKERIEIPLELSDYHKELLSKGEVKEILENIEKTGFPDPECKWHKHTLDDKSSAEEHHITSEHPDPLFIEWVYIINPCKETIIVLHHVYDPRYDDYSEVREKPIKCGGWWDYGHCRCKHIKVAEVSVRDAIEGRVNWEIIEETAEILRDSMEDWLRKLPKDEAME